MSRDMSTIPNNNVMDDNNEQVQALADALLAQSGGSYELALQRALKGGSPLMDGAWRVLDDRRRRKGFANVLRD